MGNFRRYGPTCSSCDNPLLGGDGTSCLAESPIPGPIGVDIAIEVDPSIDVGNPLVLDTDTRMEEERISIKGLMEYDIGLIAASPPGRTAEGQQIVAMLRTLNKDMRIMYDESVRGRGDWSGKFIRIKEDYRGKVGPTLVELFHEGTHALWRKHHPIKKGQRPDHEADVKDEIRAQTNQVKMYIYTKAHWNHSDTELDRRLDRLISDQQHKRKGKDSVFEQYIRDHFDEREG